MVAGLVLAVFGLVAAVFGVVANGQGQPDPVQVASDGSTVVPPTRFFQNPWVLFADIPDPRRVPTLAKLGCTTAGFRLPAQPEDMTRFGSRVRDGTSLAATVLVGHGSSHASLRCSGADSAPLWLESSSSAPPFTPTALTLFGILLLVAAALVHPAATDIPDWIHHRRQRRPD